MEANITSRVCRPSDRYFSMECTKIRGQLIQVPDVNHMSVVIPSHLDGRETQPQGSTQAVPKPNCRSETAISACLITIDSDVISYETGSAALRCCSCFFAENFEIGSVERFRAR